MDSLPILAALIAGTAVVGLSFIGLLTTLPKIKVFIEKRLTLLSSFSAGVFLMVGVMLIEEIFEDGISPILIGSIVLGALASFALSLIPEYHHHHYKKDSDHKHSKKSAVRILFSDGLHNMGDGILLAVAFGASIPLGITASIGIIIHEALQELSKFFILRQSGFDVKRAVKLSVAVSATIFLGIALGVFASGIEGILLGFAAGSLLTVVFHDLIPSTVQTSKKENRRRLHLFVFMGGALLMLLLYSLVGHSHHHEHHSDHTHHNSPLERTT